MEFLRTPDEQFASLPEYPFEANYVEVEADLRMHYLDEGNQEDEMILLLHGEPSWSFLYRKMIPVCTDAGYRVIVPDLIGFGKSDKLRHTSDYSYRKHIGWLMNFFKHVIDSPVNIFMQDWGGLLGLRLLEMFDSQIQRLILSNTFLPNGKIPANAEFLKWKKFAREVPEFPVADIIDMGTQQKLSDEIKAGYNAPFPDESYKSAARIFPDLVPLEFDDPECVANREVWTYLANFNKPTLTLFSDEDPIMRGAEKVFQQIIPGSRDMPHTIIEGAGHFLQEDKGEEVAEKMIAFIKNH